MNRRKFTGTADSRNSFMFCSISHAGVENQDTKFHVHVFEGNADVTTVLSAVVLAIFIDFSGPKVARGTRHPTLWEQFTFAPCFLTPMLRTKFHSHYALVKEKPRSTVFVLCVCCLDYFDGFTGFTGFAGFLGVSKNPGTPGKQQNLP